MEVNPEIFLRHLVYRLSTFSNQWVCE